MKKPFDEVISQYTCEQAVDDGVLHHPYPDRWPWLLISTNVNAACQPTDDDQRTYDQKLVPLLMDCILAAKAPDANEKLQRDGHLTLDGTVAGTVWITPNEKGGMTVFQPEER